METKKMILESFYRLLSQKPFEDIRVESILQDSGVSRSTFYRHFQDKYELMNSYYQNFFDSLQYDSQKDSWANLIQLTLTFLSQHADYFQQAFKTEGQNTFSEFLYHYCYDFTSRIYLQKINKSQLTPLEKDLITSICAGNIRVVINWFDRNLQETPEELTQHLLLSFPEALNIILDS